MRPQCLKGGAHRTSLVATTLLAAIVALVIAGCQVDRVDFSRLEEGKKFLAADQPLQAADYFEQSLDRRAEQKTIPVTYAHLAVAHDRAMKKVEDIVVKRREHEQARDAALNHVSHDPTSIGAMVAILEYHDLSSQSAEELLVKIGPDVIEPLIQSYRLKPAERGTIRRIVTAIGPAGVPNLQQAIQNTDLAPTDTLRLVRILGTLGGEGARAFLTEIRNSQTYSEGARVEAASALYRLGDKNEREILLASLDSPDHLVRRAAAYSLTHLNDSPAVDIMTARLGDEDDRVRLHLVTALGKHGDGDETIAALMNVLRMDESNDVANATVKVLAGYGADVIEPCLEALTLEADNEQWTRRQRIVRLLGSDSVRFHLTQDQEFKLFEHYQKRESRPEMQRDIAFLLEKLEKNQ